LEKILDVYIAEYGLLDSDVIFVEIKTDEGWAFILDYKDNKYFDPGTLRNQGIICEEPSYRKYWESAFGRSYISTDAVNVAEYTRLKRIMSGQNTPSGVKEDSRSLGKEEIKKVVNSPKISLSSPISTPVLSQIGQNEVNLGVKSEQKDEKNSENVPISQNMFTELECTETLKISQPTPLSTPEKTNQNLINTESMEPNIVTIEEPKKPPPDPIKPIKPNPPLSDELKLTMPIYRSDKTTITIETNRVIIEIKKNQDQPALMEIQPKPTPSINPLPDKEESKSPNPENSTDIKSEPSNVPVSTRALRPSKPSGIKNIGNSCYIGSSIQCLKHTKILWDYIVESSNNSSNIDDPMHPKEIYKSFSELVLSLKDDNLSIAPHQFKKVISANSERFSGIEQSDAHEFITFLIDKLHEELKQSENGGSIIEDIFYGAFKSTIQCTQCGHKSLSREPFMCISLPIEGNIDVLNIILYTQSNHILIINCKYDDDSITIQTLKEEIQKQVIVGMLDMYMIIENNTVCKLDDLKTIGDLTKCKSDWQLYAVEHVIGVQDYLVKIEIQKHTPAFLMSSPHEPKTHRYFLKDQARKIFLNIGNGSNNLETGLKSINHSLDFQILDNKTPITNSTECDVLELKSTIKTSELKTLWGKLPLKEIALIRHKTEEKFGTLHDCLNKFTGTEKLLGNNRWMCPNCELFKEANKTIEYLQLPKVLVIHLKRFKMLGKKSRKKISTLVKFPFIILLKSTDGVTHMYSLYAIMNHIGDIERGHYTAYCRNLKNRNEWLEFDDNKVKPIPITQLETEKAYVLFYEHT